MSRRDFSRDGDDGYNSHHYDSRRESDDDDYFDYGGEKKHSSEKKYRDGGEKKHSSEKKCRDDGEKKHSNSRDDGKGRRSDGKHSSHDDDERGHSDDKKRRDSRGDKERYSAEICRECYLPIDRRIPYTEIYNIPRELTSIYNNVVVPGAAEPIRVLPTGVGKCGGKSPAPLLKEFQFELVKDHGVVGVTTRIKLIWSERAKEVLPCSLVILKLTGDETNSPLPDHFRGRTYFTRKLLDKCDFPVTILSAPLSTFDKSEWPVAQCVGSVETVSFGYGELAITYGDHSFEAC